MAWRWFEIHAEQRLKLLNFFIIVAGFSIGGFFAALQSENRVAASVVAFVLASVAYLFKQLDRRSSQLLKHSEEFLKLSLTSLEQELKTGTVNFLLRAEEKNRLGSYRQIFNAIFLLFGALGLAGIVFPWLQK